MRDGGLDAGLQILGLSELRGRPAAEVIARIADSIRAEIEGAEMSDS